MNQITKPNKPTKLEILKRQRTQLKLQVAYMKRSNIFSEQEKKDLNTCYQELIQVITQKIIDKNNP